MCFWSHTCIVDLFEQRLGQAELSSSGWSFQSPLSTMQKWLRQQTREGMESRKEHRRHHPGLSVLLWQFIERGLSFRLTASEAKHVAFLKIECWSVLLHLWHPTAWRFGRCKFCSGDPGQASTACLIKSKVLNRDIYTARHQAHGWAVWAWLYKLLENFVEFRTEPRQLFARAAERATSAPSVRPVPLWPRQKRSPRLGWHGSPGRGLLHHGGVTPEGCRVPCPWKTDG